MNLFQIPQANTKLAINQIELHEFSRPLMPLELRMELRGVYWSSLVKWWKDTGRTQQYLFTLF